MGNKKNIFIGLSTLLLVLLLGLSTRTYANTYRTFDEDEFKNFLYNAWINNHTEQEVESAIQTHENNGNITTIVNLLNQYDYCLLTVQSNTNGWNFVEIGLTPSDKHLYWYNNRPAVTSTDNCFKYVLQYSGSLTKTWGFSYSYNVRTDFIYYGMPRYQSSNSNTIVEHGNTMVPFDIFKGPYSPVDDGIRFVPYPTKISDVYIGQNYNLTAYGCNKYNTYKQMLFGDLIQPPGYLINEINVTMSYYNRGKSKWVEKYLLIETGEDLVPSNYKSSIANFKWENYDSSTYTITFRANIDNEYVHDDCLYSFTFIGEDSSGTPFYIDQTFYIIGSNTIITDGTLDISFLTTGDYSNEYANDLNELASKINDQNDLINAVEQGNINSWLPGSGDWSSLAGLVGSGEDIVNTANLWGFRNYTNSYWAGLYEMMNATYTVLSQTGTVALDVSFHGYNHAITSADIPAPPPTIRNTIALCLTTFVMISIYKSFSKKIEKLKMVDTSVLKSEAHDDSDLM